MTDERPDPESLDPESLDAESLDAEEISAQTAALAAHLQRSGVHWLPKANADTVQALAGSMAAPAVGELAPTQQPAATIQPTPAPSDAAQQAPPPTDTTQPATPDQPAVAERPEPVHRAASHRAASHPAASHRAPLPPAARTKSVAAFASAEGPYPGQPIASDQRQAALDLIQAEVAVCTRCEVLSACRKNTVFGEGSVTPRVAFFGEGPGADEDRTGRPFVGKAGQLLTKMIEACKFSREDVYILNTVKCRPPGNRNPELDETENCREFYERQLAVLRPDYIVCLGAVGAQELLKSKLSVGRLRGNFHRYFESKVLVTYHPAYLLRNPAAKKAAWDDLQLMLRDAGIQI